VLFDAWRRAALKHAELVCVTSREFLSSPRLMAALVADASISFVPFMPHRRFLALYDEIDCIVLPTFEDGFSYDVADGMARGIPAIVSEQAGICDRLSNGDDAWIVPAGRVDPLADALTEAMSSRARRAAVGAAAHETVRQWTWRRFEDEFMQVVFP
jgi:glycosyltransferase involved in cell wall biosynthesis